MQNALNVNEANISNVIQPNAHHTTLATTIGPTLYIVPFQ